MSVALHEASDLLKSLTGDCGTSKARLAKALELLPRWSPNRLKDLFYADHRVRFRDHELNELRRIAALNREERAAKDEISELRARLARLEKLLVTASASGAGAHGDAVWPAPLQLGRTPD